MKPEKEKAEKAKKAKCGEKTDLEKHYLVVKGTSKKFDAMMRTS